MTGHKPPITEDDSFSIELETSGRSIAVKLAGEAHRSALPKLEDHFERLHAQVKQLHAREVLVDVRGLTFMNSYCFRALLHWVVEIRQLEADARYRVIVRHNPNVLWQRQGCSTLQRFAPDIITLRYE